jgi:hypothetical protein
MYSKGSRGDSMICMVIGVMTTLIQRNVSLWNVSEGRAGLRNS